MEHYFELSPLNKHVIFRFKGKVVAESHSVLMLKEKGRFLYDPVYYFPREDVDLEQFYLTTRVSVCPIKGKAENYNYTEGGEDLAKAAWSYSNAIEGAEAISGRIALNTNIFSVEMTPE